MLRCICDCSRLPLDDSTYALVNHETTSNYSRPSRVRRFHDSDSEITSISSQYRGMHVRKQASQQKQWSNKLSIPCCRVYTPCLSLHLTWLNICIYLHHDIDGRHNVPGYYPPYGGFYPPPLPTRKGHHSSASSLHSSKTGHSRQHQQQGQQH